MKNSRFLTFALLLIAIMFLCNASYGKDEWIQVRSKNFLLIGNASEKDIRKVGTRLEQFRETFRLLFSGAHLTSPIPTNVVVFKSDGSYMPFKPKRDDGKVDSSIAGYFQPGEDVNYITLSTQGEDQATYETIFHEYVHFIVNTNFGKSEVPAWFNEGLAEYYSTFAIEDDQKVKLGLMQSDHATLLNQGGLIPLRQLFNVSNYQLSQSNERFRSVFYAQSWALVHYLIQGGRSGALDKFLKLTIQGVDPEKAFQDTFQTTYVKMDSELGKYVSLGRYQYTVFTLKTKLLFDADMQASPLDEASADAYLGDLLYHNNRDDDAEPFLLKALKLQPHSSMINTTLGMLKIRERKFDDAQNYLQNAITDDQTNHLALYQYAYLLSREGRDEFGFVKAFSKETAAKMRDALKKAIAINPGFADSYELLAFVALVTNEELDGAVAAMQTALKLQPGNQRYAMRLADIYLRQEKFAESMAIVTKVAKTTDDPELRQRSENLLSGIRQMQELIEQRAQDQKKYGTGGTLALGRGPNDPPMTREEIARAQADFVLREVNSHLRKPQTDEKRVIARIQKIDCKSHPIAFIVKTPAETFTLSSKDFQGLEFNAFIQEAMEFQVGCDANLSAFNAVVTYKPAVSAKSATRGNLVALEFVPADFRIMTDDELRQPRPRVVAIDSVGPDGAAIVGKPPAPPPGSAEDPDKLRRDAMMQAMRNALRQPADGEKRELGYLDKIECTAKGAYFYMRTPTRLLKLLNSPAQAPKIVIFTPDLGGVQFGCGIKPIEFPAVFIYKDAPDAKAKTDGVIVSLDFVPKSFVLDQ